MKRRKVFIKKRRYQNPFFIKKRRYFNFNLNNWKNKLIILLIFSLILAFFWFLFFSSFFSIKNINISGNIKYSNDEISSLVQLQFDKKRFLICEQDNIFCFNKKVFQKILYDKYAIDEININKKLLRTINIKIKEKTYSFVWQEGDGYYYADVDGYIIREANPLEINIKETPLILNLSAPKLSDNKIKIEYDHILYAVNLNQNLIKNDFSIEKIIISEKINTLEAKIKDGPLIYFNIEDESEKQIQNLIIIKEEKLKNDFNSKNYIDLRYNGRIYYQ